MTLMFSLNTVFGGYDLGVGMGYVFDTRTQWRHPDPLNFVIFEEKDANISKQKKKKKQHF